MPKTTIAPVKINKERLKSYFPTNPGSKKLVRNNVSPKNNTTPEILIKRTLILFVIREFLKNPKMLLLFNFMLNIIL